jgi:PAS domain S-box-containing protein
MNVEHRILYLEPAPDAVEQVRAVLALEYLPCEVFWVNSREGFESALDDPWRYDLLLAACQDGGLQAGEILETARRRAPGLPLIYLAGEREAGLVTGYLGAGARDWAPKRDLDRLGPVLRRALEEVRHRNGERAALDANARLSALLRATLESTTDGVLVADLAGRITAYNRKFLSLCGIPEYVMASMDLDKVLEFLADHFVSKDLLLKEARAMGAGPDRESSALLKGEDGRTLEQTGRPHRVGAQTVGRLLSVRDVTGREQVAARRRHLADSGQMLLEAAAGGEVVLWTMTKDRLLLSGFADSLLGLETGDGAMDLDELEALFHPEDLDRFHWALEHPTRARFEARLRRDADTWIWTSWTLGKAPAGGFHGVFREVGEARAQQDRLAERRRLEWTAGIKANLAQDLRHPVQQLRAGLDALAVGPAAQASLQACVKAAASLEVILDRLTVGPQDEAGLALRLNDLVAGLGPWAASVLPPEVGLRTELQPGLPSLPQPPGRLEPVLMNLLLNARDALGGSGTITVRTGAAAPDPAQPSAEPAQFLEVEDDGPGIPPRALNHIFEPGFTTRAQSSGLGLAVVRGIVDGCGGSIEVDTEAMRGTRIRVLLPSSVPVAAR